MQGKIRRRKALGFRFAYGKIRDPWEMKTNPDRDNVTLGIPFWSPASYFRL